MRRALRDEFEEVLKEALAVVEYQTDDLGIEEPPADVPAILASNVAFRLGEATNQAPPVVAEEIAEAIDIGSTRYLADVEPMGPYLNATASDAYYIDTIEAATQPAYGRLPDRNQSVVVEHTSANPTGPIHIGRARNPIIGDALVRILDMAGYDVEAHYYVNDAGRQIAVFTWAYETFDERDLPAPERNRAEYDLVRYYRYGNQYLENADETEREAAEEAIGEIIAGLEAGDEMVYERVSEVVDAVLGGMRECLERLPAHFDEFVKETSFIFDGSAADVVERLQALDAADRVDGAWQIDLSDFDIDKEFVFVRSDGTTLYTTRDIAHHEWKLDSFDRAITVLGESQKLHAQQLNAALELLGRDTDNLEELFYGWVNLPGGASMSTRKGTGINLDDLLDEAIERARAEIESRLDQRAGRDALSDPEIEAIASSVGVGAVRYDIVSKQANKAITFEWDRALDFEAHSAPFVQYVHARCCGILERADEPITTPATVPRHESAIALTEALATFPNVIESAANERAPHRIPTYLEDLSEAFNAFYRDCPVIDAPDETRPQRLALVDATRRTVETGLGLVGIRAPEAM